MSDYLRARVEAMQREIAKLQSEVDVLKANAEVRENENINQQI
jgi:cell division protein FtsB